MCCRKCSCSLLKSFLQWRNSMLTCTNLLKIHSFSEWEKNECKKAVMKTAVKQFLFSINQPKWRRRSLMPRRCMWCRRWLRRRGWWMTERGKCRYERLKHCKEIKPCADERKWDWGGDSRFLNHCSCVTATAQDHGSGSRLKVRGQGQCLWSR